MTKTMVDLYDDMTPIEDVYGGSIEWGDQYCGPSVVFNENLRFHAELFAQYDDDETGEEVKNRLQDDDDFLPRLTAELSKHIPDGFDSFVGWSQWDDDGGGDDEPAWPYIEFTFWLTENDGLLPPETTEEEAFNKLWPAIATFINITDPGTFNCPYLFTGEVMRAPEND